MKWLVVLGLSAMLLLAIACDDEANRPADTATAEKPVASELNSTLEPREPTETPLTNRYDCGAIRGTDYLSNAEEEWYLDNCSAPAPAEPQPP